MRVVAIGMRGQTYLAHTLLRGPGGDAVDELTGAAGQQQAPRRDLVNVSQQPAQGVVAAVRIAQRIGLLHRVQRGGAWPAGIGVGGKVKARHALGIRAAVLHHIGGGCAH